MKFFKKIFYSKPVPPKNPEDDLFMIGYEALQTAERLFLERNNDELALKYYDIALNSGLSCAYAGRAFILQQLEFDLDAINDFDKAICISPDDCNLFYGRHLSNKATGNYQEALNDINQAIILSKIDNELTRQYNKDAIHDGFSNVTKLYERYLIKAERDLSASDTVKAIKQKNLNRRLTL